MAEIVAFAKRHRRALILGAVAVFVASKVRALTVHNHLTTGLIGVAPDPKMFPNFFFSQSGLWIYVRHWKVANPIGHVFLCHGLGEHIGRYEIIAEALNDQGYAVHGMDHQGHGQSEGDRCYFPSFESLIVDYLQFVASVPCGDLPCFLVGHSMGGLVSIFVAARSVEKWRGVVLSGPALKNPENTPTVLALANFVVTHLPRFSVHGLAAEGLCAAKQVIHRYVADPLVHHGRLSLRVVVEMFNHYAIALEEAPKTKWPPMFILQGQEDQVCLAEGAQTFYETLNCSDKDYRCYPDLRHELFNAHGEVLEDAINWIKQRT